MEQQVAQKGTPMTPMERTDNGWVGAWRIMLRAVDEHLRRAALVEVPVMLTETLPAPSIGR